MLDSAVRSFIGVLGVLAGVAAPMSAQVTVNWSARQDGGLSQSDYAHSLAAASDGSVYMAGRTFNLTSGSPPPPPTTDALLTKLSGSGQVLWTQRWNGILSGDERLERVALDPSGVVWCAGYAGGYNGTSYQISSLLLRYDSTGALLSSRTMGDANGPNNVRSLLVTPSGIVYGCGHDGASGGDAVVWRFLPDGTTAWMARIPEIYAGAYDTAYELALGPSGEVYVSGLLGTVAGGTGQDSSAFVARVAPSGSVAWVRTTAGAPGQASVWYSLAANSQGQVCAVGTIFSATTAQDGVALLYDSNGTQLVRSNFMSSGADYARGVAVDLWGRFFVGADGAFGTTGRDFALELVSAQGVLWRHVVDGGGAGDDSLRKVCVLTSGDLVAAGSGPSAAGSGTDALLLGLDASGTLRWRRNLTSSGAEQVFACVPRSDGGFVVGGWLDSADVANSNDQWAAQIQRTARAFCSGDAAAACPCGNASAPELQAGCANSLGVGARLVDEGQSSLSQDGLVLRVTGLPNSSALVFQGTTASNGLVFGDGLRCATGVVTRLATRQAVAGGLTYPVSGEPTVSARGSVVLPGTRTYQIWYRNSASFCTQSTFNLTNGLLVEWMP